MGFVPPELAAEGTELTVDVRGKPLPVRVVPRPFYKTTEARIVRRRRACPAPPISSTRKSTNGCDSRATSAPSASPTTRRTSSATSSSSNSRPPGTSVKQMDKFGEIESVKAVSELFSPGHRRGHRGERNARRQPAARERRPLRRRLDAAHPPERPVRDREAPLGAGLRRLHRARRGMSPSSPHPYIPNTDDDRRAMLDRIGVRDVDELFADIPASSASAGSTFPPALPELDLTREMAALAQQNTVAAQRRRVVPRRRRLPALHPEHRRPHHRPQRVLHRLHALPAGDQPGHAADDVRVPVDGLRADRHGRRQRRHVRRRVAPWPRRA